MIDLDAHLYPYMIRLPRGLEPKADDFFNGIFHFLRSLDRSFLGLKELEKETVLDASDHPTDLTILIGFNLRALLNLGK